MVSLTQQPALRRSNPDGSWEQSSATGGPMPPATPATFPRNLRQFLVDDWEGFGMSKCNMELSIVMGDPQELDGFC